MTIPASRFQPGRHDLNVDGLGHNHLPEPLGYRQIDVTLAPSP